MKDIIELFYKYVETENKEVYDLLSNPNLNLNYLVFDPRTNVATGLFDLRICNICLNVNKYTGEDTFIVNLYNRNLYSMLDVLQYGEAVSKLTIIIQKLVALAKSFVTEEL